MIPEGEAATGFMIRSPQITGTRCVFPKLFAAWGLPVCEKYRDENRHVKPQCRTVPEVCLAFQPGERLPFAE